MTYLSMDAVQADAVFVSRPRRCDEFSAGQVRQAVAAAVRAFGCSGCYGRVALEFGNHPDTAMLRMRWARDFARKAFPDWPPGPAAGRRGPARAVAGRGRLMEEGMIQAQAMAARMACARMTMLHLTELHGSVERACRLRDRSQWAREAAAHAEVFSVAARRAGGMTVSSRRRLLAQMRAGDGDAAALEMERRLRGLLYMRRLARPGNQVIAGEAPL